MVAGIKKQKSHRTVGQAGFFLQARHKLPEPDSTWSSCSLTIAEFFVIPLILPANEDQLLIGKRSNHHTVRAVLVLGQEHSKVRTEVSHALY